jgi:putative DNA primase/helicase
LATKSKKLFDVEDLPAENRWRAQLIHGRDGLRDCRENVIYILRSHPDWKTVFAADTFAKKIVVRRKNPLGHDAGHLWCAEDDVALGLWLVEQEQLVIRGEETIARSVAFVAQDQQVHPVREFLQGLKWDNVNRIDSWVSRYLRSVESEYVNRVGRYFVLNLVRRAFEPGCIMRSVPVLEGPQNVGKSTIARILAHPWFSDTPFRVGDKDAYQQIQGVWLYEIAELDSFSRAESSAVKAFISSSKDRFRAPYERGVEDHFRQTCFLATTNAIEYLRDWTGNTRFWPVQCGAEIDIEGFQAVRDQLLAEAMVIYRAGGEEARAHPTKDEEERLFRREQEHRLATHPWLDVIENYLEENQHILHVTVYDLLKEPIGMRAIDMGRDTTAEQRVGRIMAKLGWTKGREGSGERRPRWCRPSKAPPPPIRPDDVPF